MKRTQQEPFKTETDTAGTIKNGHSGNHEKLTQREPLKSYQAPQTRGATDVNRNNPFALAESNFVELRNVLCTTYVI